MILAMVAEVMTALYELLYAVGVIVYPATCHKKGNLHIVLIQNIHNFRKILRTPRRDALIVRISFLELPEFIRGLCDRLYSLSPWV
jgi:hypothetical protein